MNYFCTYCDKGYAARMLCLHASLREQGEAFRLLVLCFDAETKAVVQAAGQPDLIAVALDEVLEADVEFAAVRAKRTPVEFFFTATPVFVLYCFQREPAADRMTYLDADLFFFGPASEVFNEQGPASVGLVPHRFPPRLSERIIYGSYNVAWVSFRRDAEGLAALEWWRDRCLEWCHDRVESGRFADQGYLDEIPRRFGGVRAIEHPGVNAAPWNMENVKVTSRDGGLWVGDRRLLFYHFQGIRELLPGWFEPGLRVYGAALTPALREFVYAPYLSQLARTQQRLRQEQGITPRLGYVRLHPGASMRERWERVKARWLLPQYRRLRGQLLHVPEDGAAKP